MKFFAPVFSVLCAALALAAGPAAAQSNMIITGVFDGPLSGGTPKMVEVYVVNNISDLSIYGLGSANNGGGSDGEEFSFPDAVPASTGTYLYVASESSQFTTYFGFAPDYVSSMASINGDDAVELFMNGGVEDVFGEIDTDGSGEAWEYMDGWANRNAGTGPDGTTFVLGNWTYSGPNAVDGCATNAGCSSVYPLASYPVELMSFNVE